MMAKSLVRNRHAVTKMYQLKSQLQAVSLRIAVRVFCCRILACECISADIWVCTSPSRP